MQRVSVVVNASPLIYLSVLDHLALLWRVFDDVYIPQAVYTEVVELGQGLPGSQETARAVSNGFIHVRSVSDRLAVDALLSDLDWGESEVIVLAREMELQHVVLDDRMARLRAVQMGLNVTGTIGILLLARKMGMEVDVKRALQVLQEHNFRISERLYRKITRDL